MHNNSRVSELAEQVERLQRTVEALTKEVERLQELDSSSPTKDDADDPRLVAAPERPHREPATKKDVSKPRKVSAPAPRPARPEADVTFHLSDLKTGVACEPLDERAVPMAGIKEASEKLGVTQEAFLEIMRYLQGIRQRVSAAGGTMAPLDLQGSVRVFPGNLEYRYASHTEWDSGCYDSGSFEPGGYFTIEDHITVYLDPEDTYASARERARSWRIVPAHIRKAFRYDGFLSFEDETEAFIWQTAHNEYTLYLRNPFGTGKCLRASIRLAGDIDLMASREDAPAPHPSKPEADGPHGPTGKQAQGERAAAEEKKPVAAKQPTPTPRSAGTPRLQPARPEADVTFCLSDLKTGVACEPPSGRAVPTTVDYERYKGFFEEYKGPAFRRTNSVPEVPASEDHMRSPLLRPSGDVARDEQSVIQEIIRYLLGFRQRAVRAGRRMYPLDKNGVLTACSKTMSYTYYSYKTQTESCYDGGVCSVAGDGETITKDIRVELISEDEYVKQRERACAEGEAYVDKRQGFAYDGDLTFEDQTEAFVYKATFHSVPKLYLHRPFGMKDCLVITDF